MKLIAERLHMILIYMKAMETERRLAQDYTSLSFDPLWRDRILSILRSDQEGIVALAYDDPEDKLLPRLGQLYGVLRRMGISEERTQQCLEANRRIDLEEALEWVLVFDMKWACH
jgi:ATP-dependent RNA helicase DHX29